MCAYNYKFLNVLKWIYDFRQTNKGKYLETSKPDSTINNFAVTKNIQHQQPNMSDVDDQKSIDGNSIVSSSSSSSSGESEEDVIEGTPDRCHVS